MKPETALARLIKKHGIRRAMILFGAAGVVAVRGWEVLIGDDAYTRQGVWLWKRDLELAGVDPLAVEWEGFERRVGGKISDAIEAANVLQRKSRNASARLEARRASAAGRKSTAARS